MVSKPARGVPSGPQGSTATAWSRRGAGPAVVVVAHLRPTSKADALNQAVAGGLVDAERVLVVDGDTELDPGFVAAIRDGFYRLRRLGGSGRWVLEDVAVQSGAVTSRRPAAGAAAGFVSAARNAEYAFAVVVRRGQATRLGQGPTFGASRLFTVVGCGFVARREAFPMPSDGLTEDHDFTMQVQSRPVEERSFDLATLHDRGFRVVVDGVPVPLARVVDEPHLTLRRTADARFEVGAAMATEDPPRLSAYLHQVERWVGGALEVLVKRAGTRERRAVLPPNVRFAILTAQLENLAGLLLLLAVPMVMGWVWTWSGPDAAGAGARALGARRRGGDRCARLPRLLDAGSRARAGHRSPPWGRRCDGPASGSCRCCCCVRSTPSPTRPRSRGSLPAAGGAAGTRGRRADVDRVAAPGLRAAGRAAADGFAVAGEPRGLGDRRLRGRGLDRRRRGRRRARRLPHHAVARRPCSSTRWCSSRW